MGRVLKDETGETFYIVVNDKKCLVLDTPLCHRPANIMGLGQLLRLGFSLTETGGSFASPLAFL